MADRILTPTELADLLGVHVRDVDRLVSAGLPTIDLGHDVRRFLLSETLTWLRRRVTAEQYRAALERRHEALKAEVATLARIPLLRRRGGTR